MIFETHAHYDDDRFKEDRDVTIQRVCDSGVAVACACGFMYFQNKDVV